MKKLILTILSILSANLAYGGYENFNSYDVNDSGSRTSVIDNYKISWVDLAKPDKANYSKSKGANHFSGDFTHQFECYQENVELAPSFYVHWMLANSVDDEEDLTDYISFSFNPANTTMTLRERAASVNTDDVWLDPLLSTVYYVTITRDDDKGDHGQLQAVIRTGSHTGEIKDTLTVNLTATVDWEYVYGLNKPVTAGPANKADGYTANLNLNEKSIVPIIQGMNRRRRQMSTEVLRLLSRLDIQYFSRAGVVFLDILVVVVILYFLYHNKKKKIIKSRSTYLSFLLIGIMAVLPKAMATDYYIDPEKGNINNDGSSENPWNTLEAVFDNKLGNPVTDGDTLYCRDGYHGYVNNSNENNSDYITVVAQTGHTPVLRRIKLTNFSKWIFDGLTITPESYDPFSVWIQGLLEVLNSYDITFQNMEIYSIDDASGWSDDDWKNNTSAGATLQGTENQTAITLKDSTLRNVGIGMRAQGDNVIIDDCIIHDWTEDGIVISANDVTVQYVQFYDGKLLEGHPDCIQLHRGPDTTTGINDVTIRGCWMKGVGDGPQGIFSGANPMYRLQIENNCIMVRHLNGIAFTQPIDSNIVNNTVFDPNDPENLVKIIFSSKGLAVNCVVRNNIAKQIQLYGENITEDHNIDTDDEDVNDLFVNYLAYNLDLPANSNAVDAGSSTGAPSIDINKNVRPRGAGYDVGAYEYQGVKYLIGKLFRRREDEFR